MQREKTLISGNRLSASTSPKFIRIPAPVHCKANDPDEAEINSPRLKIGSETGSVSRDVGWWQTSTVPEDEMQETLWSKAVLQGHTFVSISLHQVLISLSRSRFTSHTLSVCMCSGWQQCFLASQRSVWYLAATSERHNSRPSSPASSGGFGARRRVRRQVAALQNSRWWPAPSLSSLMPELLSGEEEMILFILLHNQNTLLHEKMAWRAEEGHHLSVGVWVRLHSLKLKKQK